MSNVPIPPSPGPSRPRPGYGGYQPSHGSSLYANGTANSGRFRGDSWRSESTYRPRDPNADHYEPDYGDERPRFGWGASYPQSQTYDPSDIWPRRDIMAERMFEPSDSWKHGCVPDPELDMAERFSEPRGRMPPPREDYAYAYSGDSYRAGTAYMSRRDLTYPRSTDYYRPGYTEEARWGSSFPLDDASNWARQRSPSTTSRPRGRSDCRDMSYERSPSGSPRSSHFSSPKRSRAGASRRAPSPSSSSIRSSRERSKSPPRSRDRSRSSVRSSAGSRSFTPDPPVRSPVQRSHPMAFATPLLPPFRRPWLIPMSQDLTTALLVILLYLYVPLLHLIFSVDDNASLNADFLELHRADTVTPKLVEEIR
ncbi:hypothetical protein EDB84DRAFT_1560150 [Lactarius hengduanensis]|nr:hypothetical protein EDB84DRAFT_1560150 [Lactarius hengduanensis]